jgi:hypothetical protein
VNRVKDIYVNVFVPCSYKNSALELKLVLLAAFLLDYLLLLILRLVLSLTLNTVSFHSAVSTHLRISILLVLMLLILINAF